MRTSLLLALVLASPASWAQPRVIDTALGEADSAFLGIDRGDESGWSVLLQDLDGDGFDDLVIGAPMADSAGNALSQAGEVYIRYGKPALAKVDDFLATPPDVVMYGGPSGDHFGAALAARDVNGDGATDLVVGAPYGHGPLLDRTQAGQAYVFFGHARYPRELNAADADVIVYGWPPSANFGASLLVADLDGDGRPEIAVKGGGGLGQAGGAVYVFRGRPVWPATLDVLARDQTTTYFTDTPVAHLGSALAAGDVDGDGIADLAMSELDASTKNPGRGAVHVFLSSIARGSEVDVGTDPGDWVVRGVQPLGFFGHSLALGDFNGDGVLDIAAGAPRDVRVPGTVSADGTVYVVHGNGVPGRVVDLALNPADRSILGRTSTDLGNSLRACDFDGDGIDDLLVGAPIEAWDPARAGSGVARLILGARAAPPVMDLETEMAEVTIVGRAWGGALGWSVASGDMDGDGDTDLVVGAPFAPDRSSARNAAGETYLVRGPASPCTSFDDLDDRIRAAGISVAGVRQSLRAKAQAARAAYERGHLKTAENQLCALLHECDAQEGKHLSPASAQKIRTCAIAVARALGIPEPCTTGSGLVLLVARDGASLRLTWQGGSPPFSVMRGRPGSEPAEVLTTVSPEASLEPDLGLALELYAIEY